MGASWSLVVGLAASALSMTVFLIIVARCLRRGTKANPRYLGLLEWAFCLTCLIVCVGLVGLSVFAVASCLSLSGPGGLSLGGLAFGWATLATPVASVGAGVGCWLYGESKRPNESYRGILLVAGVLGALMGVLFSGFLDGEAYKHEVALHPVVVVTAYWLIVSSSAWSFYRAGAVLRMRSKRGSAQV